MFLRHAKQSTLWLEGDAARKHGHLHYTNQKLLHEDTTLVFFVSSMMTTADAEYGAGDIHELLNLY